MLQAMRTGASSLFIKLTLFGLLLMAMLGLVVMDVQGVFRKGVADGNVVKMNGGKITAFEFQRILDTRLKQQGMPKADAIRMGVPQQVLAQEVTSRLFSRAARDLGLIVDDVTAAKRIKALLKPMTDQGMTDEAALRGMLMNIGMSETGLIAAVKNDIATELLMSLVMGNAQAPQSLQDAATQFTHEKRTASYITLTAADAGKISEPTEDELKAHYETIASLYATPERRDFSVLVLDKPKAGATAPLSDDELKAHYEANIAAYTAPEKRVITQIVAKDEDTARAIAKETDIKAAAKGKDGVSVIEAQTLAEADLPEDLAAPAFMVADGSVTEPVQSPLGWHVIKVEKIIPSSAKGFESVKADMGKKLAEEKAMESYFDNINDIDDRLAGGETLDSVAEDLGLKTKTFTGVTTDTKPDAQGVPDFDKVAAQAFGLAEGEAGQMIETTDGHYAVAAVTAIHPPQNRPLDEVRKDVADNWKKKAQDQALAKLAASINDRLKSGEDFSAIAKSFGKTPQKSASISRQQTKDAGLPQAALPALFSLAKAGDAVALEAQDNVVVLRLDQRAPGATTGESAEDAAARKSTVDRSMQTALLDQYRAALMAEYDVKINDGVMAKLLAPSDTSAE